MKSMGNSVAVTRAKAFLNNWNPQYFLSGEEEEENKVSVSCVRRHGN